MTEMATQTAKRPTAMEDTTQPGLRKTLVPPAAVALLVASALVVLGRLLGSVVVAASSVHWLLLVALVVGAHSQVLEPQSGATLPVRRVFIALVFLTITLVGTVLASGFAFVVPAPSGDFLGLGMLMMGTAGASAVMARFFQAPKPQVI